MQAGPSDTYISINYILDLIKSHSSLIYSTRGQFSSKKILHNPLSIYTCLTLIHKPMTIPVMLLSSN